jgi:hypothetical protein
MAHNNLVNTGGTNLPITRQASGNSRILSLKKNTMPTKQR